MDADAIEEGRRRWQARYDAARKRDADFTTLSGDPVEPVYGPAARGHRTRASSGSAGPASTPSPAACTRPATGAARGPSASSPGFGNAEQTNERYKMILAAGGGGLSVAFDMPTLMGRDSDDPRSLGEVGHCGVAIDSAADMEVLFKDIPLGDVTTSMTISGPAVPVFCMYLVAAERQGVDPAVLNGTLQTDIFKEYIAQKEWLFQPEPHLRLIGDLMEHCAQRHPRVQAALGLRLPHPRGRRDGRAGAGVHARGRLRLRGAGPVAAAWTSTPSRPACPSSSTRTSTSSRRSPSSAPRAGSGRAGCGTCTARQTEKAQWLRFHTQTAGRLAHRAAAVQQRRTHRRRGARRGPRRHQLPAHQRPRRDPRAAQRAGRRDRAAHPAGADGGDRRRQRRRPAGRFLVRRAAHRPHRGRRREDLRADQGARPPRRTRTGSTRSGRSPPASCAASRTAGSPARSPSRPSSYQRSLEKGDKRVVGVNVHHGSVTGDLEILRVSHEVEREQVRVLGDAQGRPRRGARTGRRWTRCWRPRGTAPT